MGKTIVTYLAQLELGKLADAALEDAGLMEQRVQDGQEDQAVEEYGQCGREGRSQQAERTEDGIQQHAGGPGMEAEGRRHGYHLDLRYSSAAQLLYSQHKRRTNLIYCGTRCAGFKIRSKAG